jgi:serine/threonine-protein kinase
MADRIKTVFLAALETPIDQRPTFLDRACGGDTEVRRRVEALLRAHEEPDRLLDRPAWQATRDTEVYPPRSTAGPAPAVHQPAQAGRVHLLGEIARGGMGVVLRGHDPEIQRELAVKVILPEHQNNPELLRRFVGEARLAGQLQHPGIVPVHDVGQLADGRPFFSMKLIQGRTLADLLAERANPRHDLPRFLRYFEAVCQAVGFAHSRGVIHRDLKPANVMVGAFGEVQVMDWGLAKQLRIADCGLQIAEEKADADESSAASNPQSAIRNPQSEQSAETRPGTVIGTPGYLAPEQARGLAGDQRTDVYGLGAILCEILTGTQPCHGVGLFTHLEQAREGDVSAATEHLDHCGADPELIRLAKDCLQASSACRPADGSAVAARMAEYLAGVQERLRCAEIGQARAEARVEGERTRRRLAVGLAAALLAVVALGCGTLLLVQRHQAEQSRERARRQQAAESALSRSADLQQQGRWGEALAVLEPLRQRLDDRDGQLGHDVRQAVAELELVGRLEKIRLGAATTTGMSFARARADRAFESAFRAAGLGGPDEPAAVVAQRVRASTVRAALVAALDAWAAITVDRRRLDWALSVAQSADQPGDWGRRLRASRADPAALKVLAREAPIHRLSPHLLFTLASAMDKEPEATPLLRQAQMQHPGDFWLTFFLAQRLHLEGHLAEAAGFYRAALAVRPDTVAVLVNLGNVLQAQKKLDEACACYRRAIALDPKASLPHNNLGNALKAGGQLDEAIACYRKATLLDPKDALPHYNLGLALKAKGKLDEAIECYQRTIALDRKHADAYAGLGNALKAKGKLDEAIECYRKALQLGPKDAMHYCRLGTALNISFRLDEAVACLRKAIAIDPNLPEAHCNLGHALARRGDFAEALTMFRRGHELGSKRGNWQHDSGAWVRECERLIEREKNLLAVLAGSSEPAGASERIEWARLCVQTRRYAGAVRLFGEAFEADGKRANDVEAGHRYLAAAAAAVAGVGQGRDGGNLSDEARADLRRQALDWLKADLAAWRSHRKESQRTQTLRHWRANKALAGVRDAEGLAKLTPPERAAWGELWAEVDRLLKPAR